MRIAMIGTGYVGLVSAACFSQFGHEVICVDKDQKKIDILRDGQMPIYEPGLDQLVINNVSQGRLKFTTDIKRAIQDVDVVYIAVGTPSRRGDGFADLSYVFAAVEEVAALLERYTIIALKSTVPVGTAEKVRDTIKRVNPRIDFDVVSNPEFLREGSAIEDFIRPDRIVIGTTSPKAAEMMRQLYAPLFINETPILETSLQSAELIKYAANAFLATKISFINEIANLCEATGANVQEVARGIGLDKRIGDKFLHAGPGYGGSCFPKDTRALIQSAKEAGVALRIVDAVTTVNDDRKLHMADKIIAACGGDVKGKAIAILGVTFKPNTDDMREAPSLDIIPVLQQQGAKVSVFDPQAHLEARSMLQDINWASDAYDCAQGADCLVILTEWNEFRALDMSRIKQIVRVPLIVDLRNIYKPKEMSAQGFDYFSIGRTPVMGAQGVDEGEDDKAYATSARH